MDPETLERSYRRIDAPELRNSLDRLIKVAGQTCDAVTNSKIVDRRTGEPESKDDPGASGRFLIEWLRSSISEVCEEGERWLIDVYASSGHDDLANQLKQEKKEARINAHLVSKVQEAIGDEASERWLAEKERDAADGDTS